MAFIDGGNSVGAAVRFGFYRFPAAGGSSFVDVADELSAGETVDWYQVKTKGSPSKGYTLNIGGLAALNQRIEVFFRPNNKKQGQGRKIATFLGGETGSRTVKSRPGTYFFKVTEISAPIAGESTTFVLSMFSTFASGAPFGTSRSTTAQPVAGQDLFR